MLNTKVFDQKFLKMWQKNKLETSNQTGNRPNSKKLEIRKMELAPGFLVVKIFKTSNVTLTFPQLINGLFDDLSSEK